MKQQMKKFLLIFLCASLLSLVFGVPQGYAQDELRVTGEVVDKETGLPLVGVSILPDNDYTRGVTTDQQGTFTVTCPRGTVLHVAYLGYETIEATVTSERIVIEMNTASEALDEVVVIGYGEIKRRDVTTAITSVSTEDLETRPITSAAQAIQGRAAGVSVIQTSGMPGGTPSIRIRGTTSFNASNDPLYVVDGVPVDNIGFLAPTDIVDMQILKDASSASIYGSRAANGVIIITTKRGKAGRARITLNTQLTINKVVKQIKSLNAADYKELMDEIPGTSIPEGTTDVTDWHDEVYSTGVIQSYQLGVSDGNEKLRYHLSGGYLRDKGIVRSAFFERYNFRANIENDLTKWLKIGANISYSDNLSNGLTTGQGSNRGGVVLAVVNLPTSIPVKNPETGMWTREFYGFRNLVNPAEAIHNGKNNKHKENRLLATGTAEVTFIPQLKYKTSFTLDRRNAIGTGFTPPYHDEDIDDWGNGWDNRNMNTVLTFDNVLTYDQKFDRHSLNVMAGSSWTDSYYTNSWMSGSHYRSADIHTVNVANKIAWQGTGSGASHWGIMSVFARASYNYDDRYLVTANVRMDGSSKLHPDHRWGTFPSFSAAWRISSEDFMKDILWIDDLKIRGGWGQTGNQSGLGDYAYLQRYNTSRTAWFQDGEENALPTITDANIRTKDLTWETTSQTNIGIDFAAFNSRLVVTLDYYYKKTTDMLMWVGVPAGARVASSIQRNEGGMTNKGFEVAISSKNFVKKFQWSTDFNISFNRNKLSKLELQPVYYGGQTSDFLHENAVRNVAGRSLGGFYGYISDGVDSETGELMYRDLNGDGKITSTDKTYIGDPNPDFTFGMTNTFSYKNINLSIFIQGSYGNDIYNASRIETEGMYDGKNQSTRVLKRWRVPGQHTSMPKAGFDLKNSSYFVEDGSYLRVKDITLSYNVQSNFLKKLGINKLQPYFTATNLLTWTNYKGIDPEVNQWGNSGAIQGIDWGTYPHSKSFVFGINIEF